MNIRYLLLLLLIAFHAACHEGFSQHTPVTQLAFPGAEGFGKYTTGGRGGKVYTVANLNDDGPGSLREAVRNKEPRIIVFSVSGTIALKSPMNINNGDLTIAGQTAPGDGVCIRDYPVKINADNVIIRYLRFRLGDATGLEEDAISGTRHKDIIIDHCSISWATDECASFYYNKNFTLQWCIISESLNESVHSKGAHGYGGIWGGSDATFHHNLIASHTSRLPRFSGSASVPNPPDELVDFSNNVIYNWENNNIYGGERGRYNITNNYYKAGPATSKNKRDRILNPYQPYGKFFVQGNFLEGNERISADNTAGIVTGHPDSVLAATPFNPIPIIQQSAQDAYERVLKNAGASLTRDAVDTRIVRDVRMGTASFGKNKDGIIDSQKDVGGWPELKSLTAPKDTDGDGIPNQWESRHNLKPDNPDDGSGYTLGKSFTNVEVYIHSLTKE